MGSGCRAGTWLSGYAMEFLLRAKEKGYECPTIALQQGLKWLDDYARSYRQDDSEAISSRAYAHYVLARAGRGDLRPPRYLFDNYGKSHAVGARRGAAGRGARHARRQGAGGGRVQGGPGARSIASGAAMRDYGTSLRDLAAIVTLMLESKVAGEDPAAAGGAAGRAAARPDLSEHAGAGLADHGGQERGGEAGQLITVSLNGVPQEPRDTPLNLRPMPRIWRRA